MLPPLVPIEGSSNVKAIAYDPQGPVLYVQFHNGAVYEYMDFPPDKWQEFLNSPSKGKYLNSNIRGRYETRKIQDKES